MIGSKRKEKNNIYPMIKKKTISEVKKEIGFKLSRTAPEALRGMLPPQHLVWELLNDCDTVLLVLITDRILKQSSINTIVQKFDELIDIICDYLDSETQIRLALYWMLMINTMKGICLEEEQFESCSNLKKFADTYFIIAQNTTEDDEN